MNVERMIIMDNQNHKDTSTETKQLLRTYCEKLFEGMEDILSDDKMTELRQIGEETINEFLSRTSTEPNPIANIDFSHIPNYHKNEGSVINDDK